MKKQIILTIIEGDFQQGFPVKVEIKKDEYPFEKIFSNVGRLPSAVNLNIQKLLQNWQSDYTKWVKGVRSSTRNNPRIKAHGKGAVTFGDESAKDLEEKFNEWAKLPEKSSPEKILELAKNLEEKFNEWLNLPEKSWPEKILKPLMVNLNPDDEIRVIITTDNPELQRLPWSAWELFEKEYENSEISLAFPKTEQRNTKPNSSYNSRVKILAVFGNSHNIDIKFDRQVLENLESRNAYIKTLEKPTKKQLLDYLRQKIGWDIFFFAGHSSTLENGKIGKFKINDNESLSIEDLKNAMKEAIAQGLQLAIFNSCDGLGLANQLAELNLPQSIVMREVVPDEVAKKFLEYFLTDFSNNKSLYMSVRHTRGKLEDEKNQEFPGISWLPIIFCQNAEAQPPTWESLRKKTKTQVLFDINQKLSVTNSLYEKVKFTVIYIYKYLNLTKTGMIVILMILTAIIMNFSFQKNRELPTFEDNKKNEQKLDDTQLLSKSNIDYTKLESLLATKQFGKADEETWDIMLQVAERKEEGNLRIKDIQNFPCQDLQTIENLWLRYSDRRFGFSIQRQIYRELGQTGGYEGKIWKAFADKMGWRRNGNWLSQDKLNLETNAKNMNTLPVGHFPQRPGHLNWHWDLYPRTEACEI
ncbi:MAG: CHAT domain-containing protein [Okeania sp. SIO3B5]|uniref:GUN4 domain-containing protein n=1 Tax=Okeania sp. SIO3B5 TaxID=2607811 RepID=UPI0013FF44BF|nr:GUN4 domain-containing protein [Okeania sp. SIO3B5]NEO55355.1 CHAT domain-containing protein [Okeania sp. SIO3B5]